MCLFSLEKNLSTDWLTEFGVEDNSNWMAETAVTELDIKETEIEEKVDELAANVDNEKTKPPT
jgi:RNase H-fold protein (predicted Holliday junction resolvase)